MNSNPKVSIITVCYNSAAHLLDCLASVQSQTYANIEHVIVDGGSTDGTVALIKAYEGEGHQGSVTWISEKDKGIYDALNKGIARATGDIVGFVHSDDLLANERAVETIVNGFLKGAMEDEIDGIYGDMVFVEPEDVTKVRRIWKPGKQGNFSLGWSLPHQTLFLKKEMYEKFGGYMDHMTNAADYELILRICKGDGCLVGNELKLWEKKEPARLAYINTPLLIMKLGGASTKDAGSSAKGYKEVMESMKLHGMKVPWVANTLRLVGKVKQRVG